MPEDRTDTVNFVGSFEAGSRVTSYNVVSVMSLDKTLRAYFPDAVQE